MSELQKELRLGNLVLDRGKPTALKPSQLVNLMQGIADYESIPLTKENIEKYIDWGFEFGFNKSIVEEKYWITYQYLMENCIDGSSSFGIKFSDPKDNPEESFFVTYYIDKNPLEFRLDDTLHNLQNLFFISCGQELPINKQ